MWWLGRLTCAVALVLVTLNCWVTADAPDTLVKEFNEDTWREVLTGEWMVEFYAPWCPACNALQSAWRELSLRADSKLGVKTAAIDVTKSAGLSGRFFVTALPTIYHVKNSEFRQYKGPRDVESMMTWLQESRWRQTEPISSWKNPDSMQMSVLAWFFKLSQALRGIHTMLMETYGLPVWGSYLIFALATIFIGAVLGLLLVCCVDQLMPARSYPSRVELRPAGEGVAPPESELIKEDLVDDDAEKNSGSDTQSSDNEDNSANEENSASQKLSSEEDTAKEVCGDGASDVRKRRTRKAD